jgi:transketolase
MGGSLMVADVETDLQALTRRMRRHIVNMVYGAKSGHIGGSMSSAEILAVLYSRILKHDPDRPDWPERDRFIMSKGHCTPAQYAILAEQGYFPVEELSTFRQAGTRLQGHSVLGKPPGVDNSAGSLGMGLSFGLGIRLAMRLQNLDGRVYVLMGDGEQDEGQVWEAAMAASHHKIDGLIAIIDRNGIQNDDFTRETMVSEPLDEKYEAFGWAVRRGLDGHDLEEVEEALAWARDVEGQPACVIFDTVKGRGVSFMENNPAFHGAPPSDEQYELAMQELADEAADR